MEQRCFNENNSPASKLELMGTASDKNEWLLWGDRLCRWGISLFFLFAAIPKLFDVHGFAAVIDAYGILPDFTLVPAAVILPVVELILALGLLRNRLDSKLGVAAVLLMFITILSYAIWLGLDIDCGCFGPEDPERQAFHGLKTALARDIVMLLLLSYSLWCHRYHDNYKQFKGDSGQ